MTKIFRNKKVLLIFLIGMPSVILFGFKEMLFYGGGNLPRLCVIKEDPIPPFSFINQNNEQITNDDYQGKIYIANFMFTRCPTICKNMTFHMVFLQGELSKYEDVFYLSHTIDPEYDSPEILRSYLKECRKMGANQYRC